MSFLFLYSIDTTFLLFRKFYIDFKELGLMFGMLGAWHLPEDKLLGRIRLNSTAFLFNEHSSFGQVCRKYFCVPRILYLFLPIILF